GTRGGRGRAGCRSRRCRRSPRRSPRSWRARVGSWWWSSQGQRRGWWDARPGVRPCLRGIGGGRSVLYEAETHRPGGSPMPTQALTESTFEQTITENDIVLVDFWADWCGPCKMFAPVFEASSEENPDVVHAKIDTEAERGLAAAANITSIPTLMAFREGILVFSQPGALPAPALKQVVDAVKGLDMADVRRQIAAAGAGTPAQDA